MTRYGVTEGHPVLPNVVPKSCQYFRLSSRLNSNFEKCPILL
jgi:hypothetical protein